VYKLKLYIETKGAKYAGSEIGGDVAEYKRQTALVIIVLKKTKNEVGQDVFDCGLPYICSTIRNASEIFKAV